MSGSQRQQSWVAMGHSGERWLAGGKEAIEGLEERHDLAPFARSLPAQDLGQGPRAAAGASRGSWGHPGERRWRFGSWRQSLGETVGGGGGASGVKVEGTGLAGRLICRE